MQKSGSKTGTQPLGQSLQSAAVATLKLPPSTKGLTLDPKQGYPPTAEKQSHIATLRPHQDFCGPNIHTIWDEPEAPTDQSRKMGSLVSGVQRMAAAFEDATKTRDNQRRMMDEMHEHAMERVESTRVDMEGILAELAGHLQGFYKEYEERIGNTMDVLDAELLERVRSINTHFGNVSDRAVALQKAIDEERDNRIRDSEAVLGPVRRQVEELLEALEKEQRIRRNRDREIRREVDESVKALSEACETEARNGQVRHEASVKEFEVERVRLERRQGKVEARNDEVVVALQADLAIEKQTRAEGQDEVVDRITHFIQKFQAHVKEEGQMGC